jgi:hypothetical protein
VSESLPYPTVSKATRRRLNGQRLPRPGEISLAPFPVPIVWDWDHHVQHFWFPNGTIDYSGVLYVSALCPCGETTLLPIASERVDGMARAR